MRAREEQGAAGSLSYYDFSLKRELTYDCVTGICMYLGEIRVFYED